MQARIPQIGCVDGKGLVAGIACVDPGQQGAGRATWPGTSCGAAMEKGVLMFAPVGFGGGTVKICPPLVITEAAIDESVAVLEEAFAEALVAQTAVA